MLNKRQSELLQWVSTQRHVNIIDNHGLLTLERHGDSYALHYGMSCITVSKDAMKIYSEFDRIKDHCYCSSLPETPCDFCTGTRILREVTQC